MRALRTIIFMTALFFFGMVSVPALAGAPLNDLSDYAAFGEVRRSDGVVVKYPAPYEYFAYMHNIFARQLLQQYQEDERHRIDMFYSETDRKLQRFAGLSAAYQRGMLYFMEFPQKNNGIYLSTNAEGNIDALLIEVSDDTGAGPAFVENEILISFVSALLAADMPALRTAAAPVINGQKAYVDIWTTPLRTMMGQSGEGFYVRVMSLPNDQPFCRIAIFRP